MNKLPNTSLSALRKNPFTLDSGYRTIIGTDGATNEGKTYLRLQKLTTQHLHK
jgi:hypothetical protein